MYARRAHLCVYQRVTHSYVYGRGLWDSFICVWESDSSIVYERVNDSFVYERVTHSFVYTGGTRDSFIRV